jgi:hypothetical protein
VADAMIPIICAIVGKKDQQPRPPVVADVEERKTVKQGEDGELHRLSLLSKFAG